MDDGLKAPDFGFDAHLINPIQEDCYINQAIT